jgi:hypothetical protein
LGEPNPTNQEADPFGFLVGFLEGFAVAWAIFLARRRYNR